MLNQGAVVVPAVLSKTKFVIAPVPEIVKVPAPSKFQERFEPAIVDFMSIVAALELNAGMSENAITNERRLVKIFVFKLCIIYLPLCK